MGIETREKTQSVEHMRARRLLDIVLAADVTLESLENAYHQAQGLDVVVMMAHVQHLVDKLLNDMVYRALQYRKQYPEAKTIFKVRRGSKVEEKMNMIGLAEMKGIAVVYEEPTKDEGTR